MTGHTPESSDLLAQNDQGETEMSYRNLPSFEQKAGEAKAAAATHRRESEGHEIWESATSWFCDDCEAVYPPPVKATPASR